MEGPLILPPKPADITPKPFLHKLRDGFRFLLTIPIWLYQKIISPWLPASCIYTPSCSEYAKQSIMKHGFFKGLITGILRIFRCAGGLFSGGPDEVPDKFSLKFLLSRYGYFRYRKKK